MLWTRPPAGAGRKRRTPRPDSLPIKVCGSSVRLMDNRTGWHSGPTGLSSLRGRVRDGPDRPLPVQPEPIEHLPRGPRRAGLGPRQDTT